MTEELKATVPATKMSIEDQMEKFRRWLEGWVDSDSQHHPGLVEMVGELYEELKIRRERREMVGRALTSGGLLAFFGVCLAWLKDHIK